MNLCHNLPSPTATILVASLMLLTTFPGNARGRQVIPNVPQAAPSSARQNNDVNVDQSDIDSILAPVFDSRVLTSFIDKMLSKYMGGLLAVNLLTVAAVTALAWMFVVCALKRGCPIYNWREVGTRSRHVRRRREEEDEAPLPVT